VICRSADSDVRADSAVRAPIIAATWLTVLFGSAFLTSAEPPTLDAFFPAGGERGTTNVVTAIGKFDPWPSQVWVSESGVTFNAETNKGKFSVTVAHQAASGPRLVRLYNAEGVSEPRLFVVGSGGKETLEAEPNNHFAKAQLLTNLPITINGRLDKNDDVDSFAFHLRAGQWLHARVDAYTLMSKVDAVLRLVTTSGEQIAWNHDFTTLDPRLVWQATDDQTVVLQLFGFAYPPASDIRLTGGDAIVYRLHLAFTNAMPQLCEPPTEKEPNNTLANAERIDLPARIFGTIGAAEDEDRFRFTADKGEFIEARIEAASFGSPLDAWLKIEDGDGIQLARSDDADGSPDPYLEWKIPTNGNYIAAIGSVTHRGGKDFCYRLSVHRAPPDFRATLAAGSLALAPGATNEVKLNLRRLRGQTNELFIAFRDLPEGVTVLTTNLPFKETGKAPAQEKQAALSLRLAVAQEAKNFQGPVKLFLMDRQMKEERAVPFELIGRGETSFSHLLIESCDQLWLTVRSKPAAAPKSPAKK
jgi:hypothetical protein